MTIFLTLIYFNTLVYYFQISMFKQYSNEHQEQDSTWLDSVLESW